MEQAFEEGYDPALEVAAHAKRRMQAGHPTPSHLRRKEQDIVDRIIGGEETGHYYMLLGSKVRDSTCHANKILMMSRVQGRPQ